MMTRKSCIPLIELIVLDMAGTTVEDSGQVLKAFKAALNDAGITVDDHELARWRGASKREVLQELVKRRFGEDESKDSRAEKAYASFRDILESIYLTEGVRGIPGAEVTFRWLREHGIKIALTTGFYRRVTDLILDSLGWDDGVIDAIICSEDVARGRPAPFMIFRAMEATQVISVGQVMNIGDTILDLQAGRNAGVRALVGVLSGSHNLERLSTVPEARIIQSVAHLPELIEGMERNEAEII